MLLGLPKELISYILSFLDLHQLIHCSQVCVFTAIIIIVIHFHCQVSTLLHALVSHSSCLQYKIHLQSNHLISTRPDSSLPPLAHRLHALQACEHTWKTLEFDKRVTLALNESGSVYEFVGGYYANGRDRSVPSTGCIGFLELPGLTVNDDLGRDDEAGLGEDVEEKEEEQTSYRRWKHRILDMFIIDFTMDPIQDLLVLVAFSPPGFVLIFVT